MVRDLLPTIYILSLVIWKSTEGQEPGGGTWVFFGWVCAAWDSKMAPRSGKNFP